MPKDTNFKQNLCADMQGFSLHAAGAAVQPVGTHAGCRTGSGSQGARERCAFDDASGERLRLWMGVTRDVFYDSEQIAILPMGLCFPGKGRSGDMPPRTECAPLRRQRLLDQMSHVELTLLIGDYAQRWHFPGTHCGNVTKTVGDWRASWPALLPVPHPSPRNNIWLEINPWFTADLVPVLQARIAELLSG